MRVYVPVVGPRGTNGLPGDFKFALALNGTKATSCAFTSEVPVAVPESEEYSVVWMVASFPNPTSHRWRVEVSYEQRLLDGMFYYLPIVEGTQRKSGELSITVQADRPIQSRGKGPGGCVVLGERKLLFLPAHLGMIVVSTHPSATRGGSD